MGDELPPSRFAQIVAAARRLLEEQGPEALSMRNVAAEIGIRAPSLYEHVADKRALENAIVAAGMDEQGRAMTAAMEGAADPLTAIAQAWRTWALAHPHVYRLINARGLDRDAPEVGAAERRAGDPIRVLTGGDLASARVIWAFAHGMTMLELNARFPPGPGVDELWERGLEALRPLLGTPAD
ncbi:MAG TPA: TetR/AcrR family transcriptional regulator [Baekduia sp.]|uniref:TetR/AcrR family transcriptional regulator n=1 Tax=Baekduia sp. TaxID=2600305 RepID=UPI002B7E54DD|nr:TetR/AcrR family transcriptional regulator [Baekduia sp.]HMJ34622.1 TetR/AcrR family transcriptional regulator [Baekduia sp.]